MLYEWREAVFKIFNDHSSVVSEAKYKTIHGKEIPSMSVRLAHGCLAEVSDHSNLKVLSPKQILQRLPIGLPQVKAGDSSENVLTYKIRQIIYFLYQAKEITKKLYNNIMSSIKL